VRRLALLFLLLAACDLQPPKRERERPVAATKPTEAAPAPSPPPTPTPAPAEASSEECLAVAAHIVERVIANASDAQRPAFEQDKTRSVRNAATTCTTNKWSEEIRGCFLKAMAEQEIENCAKQLPAPTPRPAPAPAPAATPPAPTH
jgi:hypothetical protein